MNILLVKIDIEKFRDNIEIIGSERIHKKTLYKYTYFQSNILVAQEYKKLILNIDGVKFVKKSTEDYKNVVDHFIKIMRDSTVSKVEKYVERWAYDDVVMDILDLPNLPTCVSITSKNPIGFIKGLKWSNKDLKYFKGGIKDYYKYEHGIDIVGKSITFS